MTPHARRIALGLRRRGFAYAPIGNRAERLIGLHPQPVLSCSCSSDMSFRVVASIVRLWSPRLLSNNFEVTTLACGHLLHPQHKTDFHYSAP